METKNGSSDNAIGYWATRWKEQKTGWHLNKVNPTLIEFMSLLTSSTDSFISKKFFLPLSGQTYDIGYLYSLGHEVFCVEGVKEVVEGLNERDNLGLQYSELTSTYSTPDAKIIIYVGDLLSCPIEKWGPFDCVWDRASLVAMENQTRSAYVDIIKRSVQKSNKYTNFRILLDVVNFDKSIYADPPRAVDEFDMQKLYSDWTKIELVETSGVDNDFPALRKSFPADSIVERLVYLLTPK